MPGSIIGYHQSSDRESWLCHLSREGLTRCLKNIKILQDVAIVEWQKVQKQGMDDHIKHLSIQNPYIPFSLYADYGKRSL